MSTTLSTPVPPFESDETVSYREIRARDLAGSGFRPGRGFFFGMVENGTASVTGPTGERSLTAGDLLILTPSRDCTLHAPDRDFGMSVIGLEPDFFDTLPDGQPMYSQLAKRQDPDLVPILHPDASAFSLLRRTASLFAEGMSPFTTCRRGIVRHWCGLFLLQVTDLLHRENEPSTVLCVKRSDLLFREFRRLSVEHYRMHHDLGFYAEALHISATYLSRIVKRTTGHTVYAHLAGLLCAEAKRNLESSDLAIKEIADRLGFTDQSAFGKFFKSQTGLSPYHYRQRFGRPGQHRTEHSAPSPTSTREERTDSPVL